MDFFRYLIYCNGRSLKYNQIQILKIMQDDTYPSIMKKITPELLEELVDEYNSTKTIDPNVATFTPELLYLCTFFQILTSLVDNNNTVNIGKLKKSYPFELLVNCISVSEKCWPLKRNLRAFCNRMYYFLPDIEAYMKLIIDKELDNITTDLDYYIVSKLVD